MNTMEATAQGKQMLYRVIDPERDKKFEAQFHNFEEKDYLVCLIDYEIPSVQRWDICHGRTEAYERIKDEFTSGMNVDPAKSIVLVDGLPLRDRKNVYTFMKYIQQFYDDGFDIDDHTGFDDANYPEQPIDVFKLVNTGISMEEFMNGTHYLQMPLPDKEDDE